MESRVPAQPATSSKTHQHWYRRFFPFSLVIQVWDWLACPYDETPDNVSLGDSEPPSIDVGLDFMRDRINGQLSQVDAVDTKAGVLFASSSFVTGVLVAWHKPPVHWSGWVYWFPVAAIVLYIFAAGFAALAFLVRSYKVIPEPRKLRDTYLSFQPGRSKTALVLALVAAAKENEGVISSKLHCLYVAFVLFGLQVFVVAVIVGIEVAAINAGP